MLRFKKLRQIANCDPGQPVPHQAAVFNQNLQPGGYHIGSHIQQLGGGLDQFLFRQEAVAGQQIIAQFKHQARFQSPGIIACHTQFYRKAVHRAEGGIQPFVHQQVRIIVQQFHSLLAVELVHPHRQLRRELMGGKKFH